MILLFLPIPALQAAMVPKINKVEIEDRKLTASVNQTEVDGFALCMKVETTTGEPKDYKPAGGRSLFRVGGKKLIYCWRGMRTC